MKIAGITGLCGALLMLAAPVFLYGENPVVTPELKPVITLEAAAPAVKPPEPAVFKSIAPEKFSPGKCYPDVKISGSGFLKSAILKLSSESLSIDSVAGISSDTITFSLTVKEDARPGKYDITLINSPDNTVNIKNAMINLSVKFEDLSDNISRLLSVLEISAKDYLANKGKTTPEVDKDLLNKINSLLDQNKTIAQGLVMIEEKVRSKTEPQPQQQPQQNSQSQYKPRILETI